MIEVAAGASIQAAIDGAPDGATVRVAAGEFTENLVIGRPLTLQGAGAAATIVRARSAPTGADPAAVGRFMERVRTATTHAEAESIRAECYRQIGGPVLRIHGAERVTVRGIRFGAPPPPQVDGGVLATPLLEVMASRRVEIERCELVGPYWDGLQLGEGSEATVRDCLVAAMWGTGIAIHRAARGQSASSASVIGCDVRNCYHRCITIGPGCDTTRIERCWISGSAWHGVRYDDAAPVLHQNRIQGNARSGIYASGRTAATVVGNVFEANQMNGMSCWSGNRDKVDGNTFVGNVREALAVVGDSTPSITRNVFAVSPTAVQRSRTKDDLSLGDPSLERNLFWRIGDEAHGPEREKALTGDPGFRDLGRRDFAFAPDSPAVRESVGARQALPPSSPWPLTDAERQILPDSERRDSNAWKKPGGTR